MSEYETYLYRPIVEDIDGSCFYVNGATSEDKSEAIRLTKKHVAFERGAKIIRVDKIKSDD